MVINDAEVIKLVERISEHYQANISNQFTRPALYQATIEKQTWDLVERLTVKVEQFEEQAFHLDDLYHQIIGAATFVSILRNDVVPILRRRLPKDRSASDRVLQEMVINNFTSNLQIFTDLINELFDYLVEFDKAHVKNRHPLYTSISELGDVKRLLGVNQNPNETY